MNLTIEKIFTILAVIFVILFINHISAGSVRSYIWEGTNRRFANRLENCRRYTTPVSYDAPWGIPRTKYKTQILGKIDGACVIREYHADPLKPLKHYNEYRLSLEVTKELSDILKTAFEEPRDKEEKAAELALQFKKKYEIFCGYDERNFRSRQRCIKESLQSQIFNSKNKEKVENIRLQLQNDSKVCEQMQQTADSIVIQTPNFYNLSSEEQEQILCPKILKNKKFSSADYTFNNHETKLDCECGSRIMHGGCVIDREVTDSIKRSHCQFFINSKDIKDLYYWQAQTERIVSGNPYY